MARLIGAELGWVVVFANLASLRRGSAVCSGIDSDSVTLEPTWRTFQTGRLATDSRDAT